MYVLSKVCVCGVIYDVTERGALTDKVTKTFFLKGGNLLTSRAEVKF